MNFSIWTSHIQVLKSHRWLVSAVWTAWLWSIRRGSQRVIGYDMPSATLLDITDVLLKVCEVPLPCCPWQYWVVCLPVLAGLPGIKWCLIILFLWLFVILASLSMFLCLQIIWGSFLWIAHSDPFFTFLLNCIFLIDMWFFIYSRYRSLADIYLTNVTF